MSRRRDLEAENRALWGQLNEVTKELARVTAQRDELRHIIGDIRRYAGQEAQRAAQRATADAVQNVIQHLQPEARPPTPPRPSGPIHLAAHLQDPADPAHTG